MKRSERHHLKQDEFVHWLDRAFAWGMENQRNIVNATLVVVGAGPVGFALAVVHPRANLGSQPRMTRRYQQEEHHPAALALLSSTACKNKTTSTTPWLRHWAGR